MGAGTRVAGMPAYRSERGRSGSHRVEFSNAKDTPMSDLIAVVYPDRETAETVRRTLGQLALEHVIELDDAVVVSRNEKGKVGLHQAVRPTATGAARGAVWGGVLGLLFLAPLLGAAIGAPAGGASGSLVDFVG